MSEKKKKITRAEANELYRIYSTIGSIWSFNEYVWMVVACGGGQLMLYCIDDPEPTWCDCQGQLDVAPKSPPKIFLRNIERGEFDVIVAG